MVVLWGSHQDVAPPIGACPENRAAFLPASCRLHSQHTVFTSFIHCELRIAQEQYALLPKQFIPTEILLVTRPPVEGHTAAWCSCRAFTLLHRGNAAQGIFKVLLKLSPGKPFHHETVLLIKNVFLTSNYFSAVIFFFLFFFFWCHLAWLEGS